MYRTQAPWKLDYAGGGTMAHARFGLIKSHVPRMQVPAGQTTPQPPQLLGSPHRSAQPDPQQPLVPVLVSQPEHAQVPPLHVGSTPPHTVPQSPQSVIEL